MNLLFITTHMMPDNHFGGVVQSSHHLVEYLKQKIKNFNICCVSKSPDKVLNHYDASVFCSKSVLLHKWGFAPGFKRRIKPLIGKSDIVIINGIVTFPVTVAAIICKKLNKPYVVSCRGGLLPAAMNIKSWRKKVFYNMFVKEILSNAAMLHATSYAEYKALRTLGFSNPVAIIPNGVELPLDFSNDELPNLIAAIPDNYRKFTFLGRISPVKGLDILLKAWAKIPGKDRINAKLIIAGPTDNLIYLNKLKSLARSLGIAQEIIFHTALFGKQKQALLSVSDIFVLPSLSESFGIAAAEAMAACTCLITTENSPWQEVVKHNAGWWVNETELSKALAAAMKCTNPEILQMSHNARDIIKNKYQWTNIAEMYYHSYQWLLSNTNMPEYVWID